MTYHLCNISPGQVMYLAFPGELFLRMMTGITMPLLCSSVIAAVGSSTLPLVFRISFFAFLISLLTKILAAAVSVLMVVLILSGTAEKLDLDVPLVKQNLRLSLLPVDRVLDFIR